MAVIFELFRGKSGLGWGPFGKIAGTFFLGSNSTGLTSKNRFLRPPMCTQGLWDFVVQTKKQKTGKKNATDIMCAI